MAADGTTRSVNPSIREITCEGCTSGESDLRPQSSTARSSFGRLTTLIREVARECCDGRVVAVTEGGYDLRALAASLRAVIGALDGPI